MTVTVIPVAGEVTPPVAVSHVNAVYERKWGEDNQFTERYLCAIFDQTDTTLHVIGGRGNAERLCDELLGVGHDLFHFEGRVKRDPHLPYKVVSYNKRNAAAYGIEFDDLPRWRRINIVPNAAAFRFTLRRVG